MIIKDNNIIPKNGLSVELSEHPDAGCTIHNEKGKYNWCVRVNPPIKTGDNIYFCIYEKFDLNGNYCPWTSDRCARISILSPKYIHCNDCDLPDWILSKDQIDYLIKLLSDQDFRIWKNILYQYKFQLYAWDGREIELDVTMPDYTKLRKE